MTQKGTKIIIVEILEYLSYALIAKYQESKVYIDFNELSWKYPMPKEELPKVGDEIKILVSKEFDKQEYHVNCEYIGSVRALNLEENPWYDVGVYKKYEIVTGRIDRINSFGSWVIHPKGAFISIEKDLTKTNLKVGDKVEVRILEIFEKGQTLNGEIITTN